jgi:hypothetical protein
MANNKNLNPPWKIGESGNPKGKPKGTRNRSTIIRELLEARALEGDGQIADQLTRALINKAAEGDVSAFRELFDSAYGKNTDKIDNNVHYTKMGSVIIGSGADAKALEFDIGKPADNT